MPAQYPPDPLDETAVRAARTAVLEVRSSHAPLTQLQCILAACVGVARARRERPEMATLAPWQVQEALAEAARESIAQARAGLLPRPMLAGGIERLPQPQQLVLSLRFVEAMSDAEIAAVLGCSRTAVRRLATQALHSLMTSPG